MFINESKFIVFVFSLLDSLLKNSDRFKISLISHSFNRSRNITSRSISTSSIFDTSSTFDTSSIIVENSIVLLNVQHLKSFNLVFSSRTLKVFAHLLFFSIIRLSKISTRFLFSISNRVEKTRNIRDIMNDVFTNNVFDLRIDDFDIITQIENALFFEIIEITTNQIEQNNSTNQFFDFDKRFNQNIKIQFAIFVQRSRQKTIRQHFEFDFQKQFEQINQKTSFNLFINTTSRIEFFEQFLNDQRSIATLVVVIIASIIDILIVVTSNVTSNQTTSLTFQMFQQLRDIMRDEIQQFNYYIFDRRNQSQ